jgi:cytochrome c553
MRSYLFIFLCLILVTSAKAQSVANGKKVSAQCVMCHGDNGISVIKEAPNIAGLKAHYIWNQLRDYKAGKRANEIMNVIAKGLTEENMKDVAAYYSQFDIKVEPPK